MSSLELPFPMSRGQKKGRKTITYLQKKDLTDGDSGIKKVRVYWDVLSPVYRLPFNIQWFKPKSKL